MTRLHLARLKTIIDRIEANPECWDQTMWHCETTHCIGGHAQLDSGKDQDSRCAFEDGQEWLGLTEHQAEMLFYKGSSLDNIRDFYQEKLAELNRLESTK